MDASLNTVNLKQKEAVTELGAAIIEKVLPDNLKNAMISVPDVLSAYNL